jgi:uncharacterized FlaG/YvyC family protein
MDLLVNAIGASPLTRVNASGPARNNRQLDTASSGQADEASSSFPPAVNAHLDAPIAVAAQGSQERAANENNEAIPASLPKDSSAAFPAIKRAVFEHDDMSGLSLVKFMDSKGNVIMQVPPENFLKTVQLLKEFGGVGLQTFSRETGNAQLTGLLLNKKV